ncbi:MAG: enoyl-CoA hydratase/isomerase family protein [Alphaproteobacteria bacterium]|nr:enoyl-CoA hydratase/isomerase family protein [Alphaproteobacteria bacterium]MBV9816212.1 enoyl-CoA hydratase/isomerase family protein [Alphaproteobacteria bacterium]
MDTGQVILRKDGAVARIVLNNPSRLNAISMAMWDRLDQILDDVAEDQAVRVVVISGAGGEAFSAGADISEFDRRHADAAAVRAASARDAAVGAKLESLTGRQLPKSRDIASAEQLLSRCVAICASARMSLALAYRPQSWATATSHTVSSAS